MKDRRGRAFLTLGALTVCAGLGSQAVAYLGAGPVCVQPETNCQLPDQMGHGGSGTQASTSDPQAGGNGVFTAENFAVSAAGDITDVCWWGLYIDFVATEDCGPASADDFQITYYTNGTGNVPGAVLAGPFAVTPSKQASGAVITAGGGVGHVLEYEYSATHPAVAVTPDQCYWIEIQNDPSDSNCRWLWSTAAGDNRSAQDADGDGYEPAEARDYDLALCLNLELAPAGCAPPPNDRCVNAIPVTDGDTPFNNHNAFTNGFADTLCNTAGYNQIGSDIWYSYVSTGDCEITISLCDSDFDTKLAVYEFDCPLATNKAIACNDDACGDQSQVTFQTTDGTSYFIRIGGYQGAQGTGVMTISGGGCIEPPSNDNCDDATAIDFGSTAFSTLGATTDGPEEMSCDGAGSSQIQSDIWFIVANLICEDQLTIHTCQTDFDTKLAVYGAFCPGGPATAIGCDDQSCPSGGSIVTIDPVPGAIYIVRVGSPDGSTGEGFIEVDCGPPPMPCPEDTNNDFTINVTDLVNVILDWGCTSPPDSCIGDISGDGVVNVTDLVQIILAWGPC